MKNKKIYISAFLLVSTIVVGGCSSKDPAKNQQTTTSVITESTSNTELSGEGKEPAQQAAATVAAVPAFSSMSYYINSKQNDYLTYQQQQPELSLEKIVTYVNIGLNNPFYSNTKQIQNPSDILALCNKYNYLPDSYEPSDLVEVTGVNSAVSGLRLRKEAAQAFDKLCEGAKEAGYTILGASGYRSYSYQRNLYNNYVSADGTSKADTYSARAGFSEHQTGLAIDVKNATTAYDRFGTTPEYQWAKDNIHKYGFIIRYLPSTIDITGYQSEEWHFRYVGVDTAKAVYDLGITYDEYYARYLMNKIN